MNVNVFIYGREIKLQKSVINIKKVEISFDFST